MPELPETARRQIEVNDHAKHRRLGVADPGRDFQTWLVELFQACGPLPAFR